ncbi:Protein CBG26646 [Caenorhabditis briggsae]|uniref:Protein CBG26646 n=1 Tax=Caenorhabditis briggsae TaxID=6238 RepID=B6IE08_CAEBR|nr:Protein CBG26646 [Caenorhabditis briggsae]CAS01072.1 Protein CBG26646 [Caenorhabditis briggsae]
MLPLSISTSPDPASQFPTVPDLPTLTPTPSPTSVKNIYILPELRLQWN